MAHTKYLYYASKAKKDGYEQIAALFTETALNEKEHAKIWYKLLHDGIAGTAQNLQDAAAGGELRVDGYVCQICPGSPGKRALMKSPG